MNEIGWADIDVTKAWEECGYPYIDGIAWYRLTVELTEDQAKTGDEIHLGTLSDADVTWINGVKIGSTDKVHKKRIYPLPPNTLKPGKNVIAVRVEDRGGTGRTIWGSG